jgi:thioredoxin 2
MDDVRQHAKDGATGAAGRSEIVVCAVCGRKNRLPAAAGGAPRCGQCHNPLPWIVEAGDADFAEVADAARLPVLVDLWATWCGPCRMVSPILERLARQYAGRLKLVTVDVDRAPRVARRFAVQAVPTLLLLDAGEVSARQSGAAPEAALRAWLDPHLPPAPPGPR